MADKRLYMDFTKLPVPSGSLKANAAGTVFGGAVSSVSQDENVFHFGQGTPGLECHNIITNTKIGWEKTATGMEVPGDAAALDGVELCPGGPLATSPYAFTIGTDPAFFVSLKFDMADASDYLIAGVGFKKAGQAYGVPTTGDGDGGDLWGGTDYATLCSITADLKTITNLNGGTAVVTDLTDANWVDAAEHTFKVLVSAAGVVTYELDGAAVTGPAAFTFDDTDVVIPTMCFLRGALDTATNAELRELKIGYQ